MEQETPLISFTEKAEVDESFYLRHSKSPVDGVKIWKRAAIDLTFGLIDVLRYWHWRASVRSSPIWKATTNIDAAPVYQCTNNMGNAKVPGS